MIGHIIVMASSRNAVREPDQFGRRFSESLFVGKMFMFIFSVFPTKRFENKACCCFCQVSNLSSKPSTCRVSCGRLFCRSCPSFRHLYVSGWSWKRRRRSGNSGLRRLSCLGSRRFICLSTRRKHKRLSWCRTVRSRMRARTCTRQGLTLATWFGIFSECRQWTLEFFRVGSRLIHQVQISAVRESLHQILEVHGFCIF